MRKVERVEVDGMFVVTAADSSPISRANIRAQVKAIAQKAREAHELMESSRQAAQSPAQEPIPSSGAQRG